MIDDPRVKLRQRLDSELLATEPVYGWQAKLVEQLLDVVEDALEAEHVDVEIGRRVLDRIVYGATPSTGDALLRRQQQQVIERMLSEPIPGVTVPKWMLERTHP